MNIEIDDLSRPAIHALLNEHLQSMRELSPPESIHALDLQKLRQPEITFWSAWEGPLLLGCGALKALEAHHGHPPDALRGQRRGEHHNQHHDQGHGEIKSMRTPAALRRRGAGRAILAHIIDVARSRAYDRLSLETGAMQAFKPAQTLYQSFGFTFCGPFGDYVEDPNSVFMTLRL